MKTHGSFGFITLRFAGWFALLGVVAIAACDRGPTPPEKMTIAPAQPGTASGFAVLRQDADADRAQEASDNRFDVTTAYAFIDRDSPEYYDIVLLDKPLDNQKLAEATDPGDVVEDALRAGANGVVLMADGEGDISGSFQLHAGGKSTQFGGSGTGDVRGLARTGDRVKGHVHYFGSTFGSHMAIDAAFDAPLILAPQGKPLPPDGGEPAEAYLATIAAMRAGDVDALVKLMAPERAKMIESERGKPDFAENVAMLKMMAPEDVQVTGGTSYGERVVLNTKGTDAKQPFTGTVEMNWEAGGWRMGNQSSRVGGGGDAAEADAPKAPRAEEPPPADPVPVHTADGVAGKGFRHGDGEFSPTEGFAVALPADEFGEGRMLVLLAADKVEPKNAKAMWTDDTPLASLFGDGKVHKSIWLNLRRDERGELGVSKAMFVDEEGRFEEGYVTMNAIETSGRVVGVLTQSGSIGEQPYEGVARFNLPVLPAP
jgi:hypothetical protein